MYRIFVTESHWKDFKKEYGKDIVLIKPRTKDQIKRNYVGTLRGTPIYIVKEKKEK